LTAVLAPAVVAVLFVVRELRRVRHAGIFMLLLVAAVAAVAITPFSSLLVERIFHLFELRDLSMLERALRAYTGVEVFLDNAWVGVGPGGFAFLYPRSRQIIFGILTTPLNTWLYFLTDVGIIGCIPLVVFIVNIVRRTTRAARTDPLASIYLWSLVAFAVLLSTIDYWYLEIIWFELAMVLAIGGMTTRPQPAAAR
jgi:O-antigen ligase